MILDAAAVQSRPRLVQLGEVVGDVETRSPARDAPDGLFTYIDLSAIDQNHKVIAGARALVGSEAPSRARQVVRAGDVLVSTVRPNLNGVALVTEEYDGAIASTGFCVLRPCKKRLDSSFLFHWVRTEAFIASMVQQATGASYPAVTDRIVRESLVPAPASEEQRRIAAILDQADALRAKRRAALARLDEMGRAIFAEMFGSDASVEQRWPTVPLGEVLDFITSGSRGWAAHYSEQGDLFIRIQNVTRNGLDLSDVVYVQAPQTMEARRTRVQAGDVLLSITADLGRTAAIPEGIGPAYINQHLALLRQSRLHPVFLSQYLSTPHAQDQIQRRNKQGVKAGLNFDDVKALRVPLPPRTRQDAYAERYAQLGRIRAKQIKGEKEMNALFTSLQHRAFRGEL